MDIVAYGMVVVSAIAHAYWNYLLKRRGGTPLFVGLSKVGEVALFAPAFAAAALPGLARQPSLLPLAGTLIVVGAGLTLANYAALALAYSHGELSLVYPVSRGAGLLFLPPLGYLVFGERLDATGWMAIALIVAGLVTLQLPALDRRAVAQFGARARSPAVAFALLAGLAAAGYTVWDKRAIGILPAFTYFYAYTVLVAAAYGAFLARRHPREAIRAEWRANRWAILQVGFFNTVAYLLVLLALRAGTSSYVIALRQLSIAFGVLLGWRLLREEFTAPRRLGVALLLAGCALVALAR